MLKGKICPLYICHYITHIVGIYPQALSQMYLFFPFDHPIWWHVTVFFFWNIFTFSEEGWWLLVQRNSTIFFLHAMLIKSIGVHRNSTSSILKVFLGFSAFRVVENHQDVRNQLRKSTRTYKDKGVLATLEIIISYIHICIRMYYSYRSAIATSSTKPIADITHWRSSCFGWDRRSSLPAGSTHAAQESRFYPRTELMWDAKKDTKPCCR